MTLWPTREDQLDGAESASLPTCGYVVCCDCRTPMLRRSIDARTRRCYNRRECAVRAVGFAPEVVRGPWRRYPLTSEGGA